MNLSNDDQIIPMLQKTLRDGRQATLTVTSNSMSPLICRGDQVMITVLARPLQPGDIITVQTDVGLLTHRFCSYVPGEDSSFLITRGDKPTVFDPPTPAANVLGQVMKVQRHGRWLHLHQGRGWWLNWHLAWLATLDNQVLAKGLSLPVANYRPVWWRQGIHWALHWWGRVVTAVFTLGI